MSAVSCRKNGVEMEDDSLSGAYEALCNAMHNAISYELERGRSQPPAVVITRNQRATLVRLSDPVSGPYRTTVDGPDMFQGVPVFVTGINWQCPTNLTDLRYLDMR